MLELSLQYFSKTKANEYSLAIIEYLGSGINTHMIAVSTCQQNFVIFVELRANIINERDRFREETLSFMRNCGLWSGLFIVAESCIL